MNRLGLDQQLIGIDTNVLLRAVLEDDEVQTPIAQRALASLTPDSPGFISMITLVEMYWVLTRKAGFGKEAALTVFHRLVEADALEFDDGEGVVRALALAEEGADFADALIHVTMGMFGTTENVTLDRGAADHLGWRLLDT